VASERGAEWIAVDGEQFDRNHLSAVAPSSARILLLDDFGRPDGTPADLVLNQNPGSSADRYPGVAPDRLLLGTDHILLRPSFLRWQHWTRPPTEGRSVLVFLGGRDPDGSTPRVVAALAGLGGPWRFEVVVGPAASEAVTAPDERFRLHRTVGDMADLMAGCDQGVVAAGGTMWELLFMQVATVSFARNEVQRRVVGDLAAKGAVVALGGPATAPIGDVVAAVEALAASPSRRRALGEAGRRVVDGDGAQRVVDAMRTASDG
jgi:spore coat polysaccharide biosynthesis predicted glycosyltransferase SpsG